MRTWGWVVVLAIGCGSDDGGGSSTASGDCALDIVVAGGHAWKSADTKGAQLGCGSTGATGTHIGVEAYGPGDDYHEVAVTFEPPLVAEQIGDVAVTVDVVITDAMVTRAEWRSDVGACSFKIVKNELTPSNFFPNKYVIGGTVTCSSELAARTGTALSAITVNAFKFQSFDVFD